jgi:two-component system response regulator GlrR
MSVSDIGTTRGLAPAESISSTDRQIGRRREDRVVGASPATRSAIERASAAARSSLPTLITGGPGVGKEFLARAIHAWGDRATSPIEVLACDALPEALQRRELFGCAAGVHALLPNEHEGALARVGEGTLVLARVDGLRPDVRKVLVAACAEGAFTPEGGGARNPLRARVVATSRTALDGVFGDLPHHEISLLPLSQRPEDILPLAAHFLRAFAEEAGLSPVGFTAEARAALHGEGWSGNVRELRERLRQAVRLAGNGAISAEALMLANESTEIPSFKEAKRAFETRYVTGLLRRCGGNISRAARLAKKDRKDFYDVIRRTGIDPSRFR